MRARTLVFLALLVATFLALRFARKRETGVRVVSSVQERLCPGLEKERVSRVRIDHLERGFQLRLERDARGTWFLTDPIAYPALDDLMRTQVEIFERALGERISEPDLAEVGLDPPLVVVELDQVGDGGTRTFRLEVGKVDLDPDFVYVLVPAADAAPDATAGAPQERRVFRTLRTLYTTLDRNPDDYRTRRVTSLDARDVVRFVRRGSGFDAERGGEIDLAFEGVLEPEGWICKNPPIVRLDRIGMELLARGSAELEVDRFADDAPRSYAPYGLDPPRFTVEIYDAAGAKTVLDFGTPEVVGPALAESDEWYARRGGFPHVFEIETRAAKLLSVPADLLYDTLFLRAKADDVAEVECIADGRSLFLRRVEDGWTVSESAAGEPPPESAFRADPARVQDVLSILEHLQVTYPPDFVFVPEDPPLAISVTTRDGLVFGGRIGKPFRDTALGSTGHGYQRYGDERAGWIGEQAVDVARSTLQSFRSSTIHSVRETDVNALRIRRGDTEHGYVQASPLEWYVEGTSLAAPRSLTNALEVLLALEAERWLDDVPPEALVDPLAFRVKLPESELAFRIARGEGDALLCEEDGHVAEVSRQALANFRESWGKDLLDGLLELFPE
jgi:hypothetical protein